MAEGVVCAGVDWAPDTHDVYIADAEGERLWAETVTHDEAGITKLCRTLVSLGVQRIAVERPDGLLVERMLDAWLTVIAMHPNQVAAARPRFRPAGGKSDRFDAFVLCELARTDSHRFRELVADSDQTKALRALTRGREVLVEQRVALCNQLRAELERFWPGAVEIFADLDGPIALAFLARYPSPADARGLGEKRLAQWLARHHYCGRRPPNELLDRLRAAPSGRAAALEAEARRGIVLALVAALHPIVEQIRVLTAEIGHALHAHPDGPIFLSLFRDRKSVITAATLLAEIGDCRARYPTAEHLAADAGMSPVAFESGRKKVTCFRRGFAHRLRDATSTLADATRHWHRWAADRYASARGRGHNHPRAIRTLGRAWCRILWRCRQDGIAYDPARHRGLQQHTTVTIPTTSVPRPDLAATQRMLGPTVTDPAAQTAECKALDGKPTPATPLGG
jgi:transposase